MSNDPYAEVEIHSPNKSAMGSIIVGMFMTMEIPIWIKPGIGDSFKIAYPLIRAIDAQAIFKNIESYKQTKEVDFLPKDKNESIEETTYRNGSVLNGLSNRPSAGEVDGGTRTETDALPPISQ